MGAMASQITGLTIVHPTVYSDADQRKHQSSASLAFVRGIYRGPVNSPHKWPLLVTRKMFPFDDVIMWDAHSQCHKLLIGILGANFVNFGAKSKKIFQECSSLVILLKRLITKLIISEPATCLLSWFIQSWWRHQMESFSALLVLCAGNSPVTGEFPHTKASDAEFWCFLWSAPE